MLKEFFLKYKFICVFTLFCVLFVIKSTYVKNYYTNSVNSMVDTQDSYVLEEDVEDSKEVNKVVVDIKGAVVNPGVYEMEEGDRIGDLIEKSGGMTHDNTECVNLAQKLVDEEVIVIPEKDTLCESVENNSQNSNEDSDKVNINTGGLMELQTLNGIGETRAQDIIDYREQNGSFEKIEDIKNVSGIGDTTYEKLKDSITV